MFGCWIEEGVKWRYINYEWEGLWEVKCVINYGEEREERERVNNGRGLTMGEG